MEAYTEGEVASGPPCRPIVATILVLYLLQARAKAKVVNVSLVYSRNLKPLTRGVTNILITLPIIPPGGETWGVSGDETRGE